jgi:hypothetical protein
MFRELRNIFYAAEAQNSWGAHAAFSDRAFEAIVQFFFIFPLRFPA